MATGERDLAPEDLRRHRTMAVARWFGVAFGFVQVGLYETMAYPPGLERLAWSLVMLFAVANLAFEIARRRVRTAAQSRRLAAAAIAGDVLVASGIAWIYAFDPVSAIFVILILVPIEGALYFQLRGAAITWAAVAVLYVGREWFGTRYDNPWEWPSLTFRIGIMAIVAGFVGSITRDLVKQQAVTERALTDLRRADAWRKRLIAMLAHDVRAPLAAMRTGFQTIQRGGDRLDRTTIDSLADVGVRQADRAMLLARDLLDLARVEEGNLHLEVSSVRLLDVVSNVRSLLGEDSGEQLVVGVDQDVLLGADAARLEQVLYNLLSNAIHHGRPPVEVTARTLGDQIEVSIRDHGAGVPEGVALFEAFAGWGAGSVGLGLWSSRAITEAHGGTLTYRDAGPGAEFLLRLPRAAATGGDDVPDSQAHHAD